MSYTTCSLVKKFAGSFFVNETPPNELTSNRVIFITVLISKTAEAGTFLIYFTEFKILFLITTLFFDKNLFKGALLGIFNISVNS